MATHNCFHRLRAEVPKKCGDRKAKSDASSSWWLHIEEPVENIGHKQTPLFYARVVAPHACQVEEKMKREEAGWDDNI